MKQISCSLRQRSTVAGGAAVLTPSAWRTSALPQHDVAAREPCFATGRPAPAITKAAAVETLKVFATLDPVPAVSIDRKSTRLNSSHSQISYAVFCLKKKNAWSVTGTLKTTSSHLPAASTLKAVRFASQADRIHVVFTNDSHRRLSRRAPTHVFGRLH